MKSKIIAKLTTIVIFASVMFGSASSHYQDKGATIKFPQNRSNFRYIIFKNDVVDIGRPKDTWRRVKVLIEESSFSEIALKSLYYSLSKRFPAPDWLEVEVYTSLRQVPTPEEEDVGFISEREDDPEFDKHHRALLLRLQGNELIRYTVNPPDRTLKTEILKGRDPFGK